jgi:hypothetical protein
MADARTLAANVDITRNLGLIEKPLRTEQLFTNAFFDSAR